MAALPGWARDAIVGDAVARDAAPRPPRSEVVVSPDGRVGFEIVLDSLPGDEAARHGLGILRRDGVEAWRRLLSAAIRPRFAVVADSGRVAVFGQWENTVDDMQAEVLDGDGEVVALIGRAAIERAVGLPAARIIPAARHGVWLDRLPVVRGDTVLLGAAGRGLVLDLARGTLAAAP
jgi:hypothetical protein